jgi:peroxiredoxin
MKRFWLGLLLAAFAASAHIAKALPPGSTAPDFKGVDSNGVLHSLSEYRGKFVVLEWANRGCPYEQKHYKSGNMESLQKQWTDKGVVWLSILSDPPGQQGYVTPAEENEYLRTMHASPSAALLDPTGAIGRLYDARTTPHIFVVDPVGKLIYQGAIDDQPTPDPASLKVADNYLNDALNAAMAGRPVAVAVTKPYGCAVHYAH